MPHSSLQGPRVVLKSPTPAETDFTVESDITPAAGTENEPPRHLYKVKWPWVLAALTIAFGVAWYAADGRQDAPELRPLTVRVDYGDIENTVTAAGTLQPSQYVDVGAQVSGQLDKLHVDIGDEVKTGDLLAEIDATVQLNKVEASRANLDALQAQQSARESAVALAQARMERQIRMMKESATSQDDFDDAVDRLESAQSSLAQLKSEIVQAKATLGSDEATLGYSSIYAPTDGTVVSISITEGQTLNAMQTAPIILRIADLTTMTVEAEVSEADVSKLEKNMDVYFTTLGGGERRWKGRLRQILPTPIIENNVVLYTALFDVDNTDAALLPDMTAQVFFVTEAAQDVLKVPVGALTFADASADSGGGNVRPTAIPPGGRERGAGPPSGHAMPPGAGRAGNPPGLGVAPSSATFHRPPGAGDTAAPGGKRMPGGPGRTAYVKVVGPNGEIQDRTVHVGVTSRISAEVLSGLSEGEEVVAGNVDTPKPNPKQGRPFGPF